MNIKMSTGTLIHITLTRKLPFIDEFARYMPFSLFEPLVILIEVIGVDIQTSHLKPVQWHVVCGVHAKQCDVYTYICVMILFTTNTHYHSHHRAEATRIQCTILLVFKLTIQALDSSHLQLWMDKQQKDDHNMTTSTYYDCMFEHVHVCGHFLHSFTCRSQVNMITQ